MASWMIHLRIADELFPQLENVAFVPFVMGNIAPDSGVPNADWTAFRPSKAETHFHKKGENGTKVDVDAFCSRYFNDSVIKEYDRESFSFFLGYYVHLLTDVRWVETVHTLLREKYPKAYAEDKKGLILAAKEDWYDLDYLYLEQHPDFGAFAAYENAAGFANEYMELFDRDAFDNRRAYICDFYRSGEHGDLHRAYRYLTPEQADAFVSDAAAWIREQIDAYCV